jgi:hypothetical protein
LRFLRDNASERISVDDVEAAAAQRAKAFRKIVADRAKWCG